MLNFKFLAPFSSSLLLLLLLFLLLLALACERISIKTHSIESSFDTGPKNVLYLQVIMCTFQPGKLAGWDSEEVKGWPRKPFVLDEITCRKVRPLLRFSFRNSLALLK